MKTDKQMRVSKETHDIIRLLAFNKRISIKELLDITFKKYGKRNKVNDVRKTQ